MAQNSNALRSQEDYITQVSEEIEGRFTKKLSKEFSRTENREPSRLDDFLKNALLQGRSGTAPVTYRNLFSTNHGTNEDDFQSDPHTEAGIFHNQTTRNPGPEDGHDTVTECSEEIRHRLDMVTGVLEEVTYCSPKTSSGKQKKNRSTSPSQFRSENTPATLEVEQTLLAFQQLANNNNSAKIHNNSNRISKFPKSLGTTMPTFDGKSEKFELFEDLFQTSLEIPN